MFHDATRMVTLIAAAMRLADFNVDRLAARAGEGGTTLTELADTLVRDHGLPFRSAHAISALLLKARTEDPKCRCRAHCRRHRPRRSDGRSNTAKAICSAS
jgi:argininosuccinate lyase